MIRPPEELINKALTIRGGMLKGARVTPTPEMIKKQMIDYHKQFEKKPKRRNK